MSKASRPTGKLCAAGAALAGKLKFPQPMELIVRKMNSRLDGIIPLFRAQSAPAPRISGTYSIYHSVNLATAEIGKMRPSKRDCRQDRTGHYAFSRAAAHTVF